MELNALRQPIPETRRVIYLGQACDLPARRAEMLVRIGAAVFAWESPPTPSMHEPIERRPAPAPEIRPVEAPVEDAKPAEPAVKLGKPELQHTGGGLYLVQTPDGGLERIRGKKAAMARLEELWG